MKTLILDDKTFDWIQNVVWYHIDSFYDDPYGCCDYPFGDEPEDKFLSPRQQICEQYATLRRVCQKLNVDWHQILQTHTTEYERNRINNILADVTNQKRKCVECGQEKLLVDSLIQECADCTCEPREYWVVSPDD